MKLSIIIPACNEEANIDSIYNNIRAIFSDINFEVVFVDDGSKDKTYKVLESVYRNDKEHVKVISFSRNFGKDAAIYAGMEHATGEYTAIIDADMEQNPTYLENMMTFLDNHPDYDQVAMTIQKRNGNVFKRLGGKLFYKFINFLSDTKFVEDASDFRMFRSTVKEAILNLPEKNRFSKGIFSWVGFNTKSMEYKVGKRKAGKTKFNLRSSFKYAVNGVVGFSVKPLKLATFFGTLSSVGGFVYLVYLIVKTLIRGADTPGFATLASLTLFLGGIQLIAIGILGEYIAKMFIETKNRPIYVARKKLGFDEEIL